jgi:hypothetical protein
MQKGVEGRGNRRLRVEERGNRRLRVEEKERIKSPPTKW